MMEALEHGAAVDLSGLPPPPPLGENCLVLGGGGIVFSFAIANTSASDWTFY